MKKPPKTPMPQESKSSSNKDWCLELEDELDSSGLLCSRVEEVGDLGIAFLSMPFDGRSFPIPFTAALGVLGCGDIISCVSQCFWVVAHCDTVKMTSHFFANLEFFTF